MIGDYETNDLEENKLSYINKKTFEITNNLAMDTEEYLNDYFEVDELIAEAVAELNKKGYKTKFSCSGHTYKGEQLGGCDVSVTSEELGRNIKQVIENKEKHIFPSKYLLICESDYDEISIIFEEEYPEILPYFINSDFEVGIAEQWEVVRETPGSATDCGDGRFLPDVEAVKVTRSYIEYTLCDVQGFVRIYDIVAHIQELLDIIEELPEKRENNKIINFRKRR